MAAKIPDDDTRLAWRLGPKGRGMAVGDLLGLRNASLETQIVFLVQQTMTIVDDNEDGRVTLEQIQTVARYLCLRQENRGNIEDLVARLEDHESAYDLLADMVAAGVLTSEPGPGFLIRTEPADVEGFPQPDDHAEQIYKGVLEYGPPIPYGGRNVPRFELLRLISAWRNGFHDEDGNLVDEDWRVELIQIAEDLDAVVVKMAEISERFRR